MVEEVGEPMLGEGLPKREASGALLQWRMNGTIEDVQNVVPWQSYIEFGAKACTKRRFPRPKGREPEGGPS